MRLRSSARTKFRLPRFAGVASGQYFCSLVIVGGFPCLFVCVASIELIVGSNDIAELILSWSRGFRADELTVEDIRDRLARLDVSGSGLPKTAQKRIVDAQRELDAILWGMCEAGQRAEIGRIFTELEPLLADHKAS